MHELLRGMMYALVSLTALLPAAASIGGAAMNDLSSQDPTKDFKNELGFKSWPGSNGPLKPGLKFVPGASSSLAGYTVKKDTRQVVVMDGAKTLLRSLLLVNGDDQVTIAIQVCQEETKDAHEALLRQLTRSQAGLDVFRRGDQGGILIGDLNFVRDLDPAKVEFIYFVRNNIRVAVSKSDNSTVNVVALATDIDGQIVAEPNFTKKTIKTQIPTISAFAPQSSTIPPLSSTPLTLNVTDPQGRKLEFQLKGNLGQIIRDDSVSPPKVTFSSDDKLGQAQISIVAINENLLFDSAATTVTIQ